MINCFSFAPKNSIPALVSKICNYLSEHPGWSREELEDQIKQYIGQIGVESFNGRSGAVVLSKEDVNNLKITSAYFADDNENIDELDLLELYNQGVRFVFTNYNSVTSGYDLAFALEYFSDYSDVVYHPMATGSGGGNIVSVNGKTGIVKLSLSDILGDSGAQVKLCTAMEFTSNTTATWNAYYEDGYRIVGVVNSDSTAIDYIYLLKQDENNHQPIGLSTGASDAYTPTNPPPYPVTKVNGDTGKVFTLRVDPSDPGIPTDTPASINATTLNGKGAEYYATAGSVKFEDLPVYIDTSIVTNGNTLAYCVGDIVVVNVNVNFTLNNTPANSVLVSGLPISKRSAYAALSLSDGSAVRMRIHENKDCVTTDGVINVKGWSNGQIVYIKK